MRVCSCGSQFAENDAAFYDLIVQKVSRYVRAMISYLCSYARDDT